MRRLPDLPAIYQAREADYLSRFADLQLHETISLAPGKAITIRCAAGTCCGNGGHLVAYSDTWQSSVIWMHVPPRGYVRSEDGAARKSQRRREREHNGRTFIGRHKDAQSRSNDLHAKPLGPMELPGDSWGITDPAETLVTECCDCGRPLSYSLTDALRAA